MRRESAAARAGSFQPKDALLRPMTQPATSGPSWPGFATGFVAVEAGPRPAKAPRPPAGATYFAGVGPSNHSTAARVASGASVPFVTGAGALTRSIWSPMVPRH